MKIIRKQTSNITKNNPLFPHQLWDGDVKFSALSCRDFCARVAESCIVWGSYYKVTYKVNFKHSHFSLKKWLFPLFNALNSMTSANFHPFNRLKLTLKVQLKSVTFVAYMSSWYLEGTIGSFYIHSLFLLYVCVFARTQFQSNFIDWVNKRSQLTKNQRTEQKTIEWKTCVALIVYTSIKE